MLDAGVCVIFSVDWDETGPTKTRRLTEKARGFFEERAVGFSRHFEAGRNGQRVDRLLRLWRTAATTRDLCQIDDVVYHILQVQHKTDEDGMLVTDLTLQESDDGEC